MSRDELLALAKRVEKATADEQRIVLSDVGDAVVGIMACYDWNVRWLGFLNNNAFLDAAMTLVPEGWFIKLDQGMDGWNAIVHLFPDGRLTGNAATPALALTAAALRALAKVRGEKP